MDIAEFLLARIAEDEAVAREVIDYRQSQLAPEYLTEPDFGIGPNVDVMGPDVRIGVDRFVGECDAKRRIVGMSRRAVERRETPMTPVLFGRDQAIDAVLELLALPYADHPGYREEWAPQVTSVR